MLEFLALSAAGYAIYQMIRSGDVADIEMQKKRAELAALLPPKPEKRGWFAPKPPKTKTRTQMVREAETLLAEELQFCRKLSDPIARQAAETAAFVRFRQRLMTIMEITP